MTTTVFAHFDGKQSLVLEEPVELPVGMRLRLHVEPVEGEAEQPTASLVTTVTRAGLLTNDAITTVALMQRHGLIHMATNDDDFDRVPGITVWKPRP